VIALFGQARNYGPSAELQAQRDKARQMLEAEQSAQKAKEQQLSQLHQQQLQEAQQALDTFRDQRLAAEQQEQEKANSLTEQRYMMLYIVPALREALLNVSRLRPADPVDYVV